MRRFLACCLLLAVVVLARPGEVRAHNSLSASTPANGAVLAQAPTEIVWSFANPVPLETLTVTLIDATGVRTELPGSTHGPSGDREVVTPLPPLPNGDVSVRWRLVGADGHPISERVTFTVQAPVPTTATAPVATTPTTLPTVAAVTTTTSVAVATEVVAAPPDDSGVWSTPRPVRWLLRGVSYVSIMVAAGVVLTHLFVLRAGAWAATGRWLQPALVAIGVTALLQLLVTASDVGGAAVWRSLSSIDEAVELTDAGAAYMVRLVVAVCAWIVLIHAPPKVAHVRNELLMMLSVVFLATWSFAGHSSSMRWPALGIPLDVIHHGAAAAWIGGLVIVGVIALPAVAPDEVRLVMQRFSRMATVAVVAIVATGLVQAVRLVGEPTRLLEANHGRLLVAKVVALGAMLALADANRRRLTNRTSSVGAAQPVDVAGLRRGMLIELVVGLVIIGITAAMVVSPPATSAGLAAS